MGRRVPTFGPVRDVAKKLAAAGTSTMLPQARYDRALFVLSHMRATTTALSNVLCSHPAIAGYGETHVTHRNGHGMGQVVVNLALRRAWDGKASWVLDKILHHHLDTDAPQAFFGARAIFVVRSPAPAIASIRTLSELTGMVETATAPGAAQYYAQRVETLARMWEAFRATNRIGLTSEALLSDPDTMIDRISSWLALDPRLRNEYRAHAATQTGGGGDPTRSAHLNRIEQADAYVDLSAVPDVPSAESQRCIDAYLALVAKFEGPGGKDPAG